MYLAYDYTTIRLRSHLHVSVTVSTAIAMAAAALFNPWVAGAIVGFSNALNGYKFGSQANQDKSQSELFVLWLFNIAFGVLQVWGGGIVYTLVADLLSIGILGNISAFILGGFVCNQIGFWGIIVMVYLANQATLRDAWITMRSSLLVDISTNVIGGIMIWGGVIQAGILGALFFSLPLMAAVYTYHTTTHKTDQYISKLEEQFEERTRHYQNTLEAQKQLMRVQEEFLANMSHELRTPLTGIIGFGDLLGKELHSLREEISNPDALERIELMMEDNHTLLEEGRRLKLLINDLLSMAQIESGKLEMKFEVRSPRRLGEIALRTARGYLVEKKKVGKILLHMQVDDELPFINVDPQRIDQILDNLLSNAIKFTEQGEVALRIYHEGGNVHFSVSDTGVGIDEEDIPRLFLKFERVQSRMPNVSGTGLGLSIAQQLAKAHGGDIVVKSVVNAGSTFTLRLPVYEELEEANHHFLSVPA